MKEDRFLTWIVIGIAVLVIMALGVYFFRDANIEYLSDETPEGVVHNYILAIQLEDYNRAYDYLVDWNGKPSFSLFRSDLRLCGSECSGVGVQILETSSYEHGDGTRGAEVSILVHQSGNGPFDNGYSREDTAQLVWQDGSWRIQHLPYPLWAWNWDNPNQIRVP